MTDYKWEVGQRVSYSSRYHSKSIETIERVTPSGRAVIGYDQYGKDGIRIGCKTSGGFGGYVAIMPLTPELEEQVERQQLCTAIGNWRVTRISRNLTTPRIRELADQLKAVIDELEGKQ